MFDAVRSSAFANFLNSQGNNRNESIAPFTLSLQHQRQLQVPPINHFKPSHPSGNNDFGEKPIKILKRNSNVSVKQESIELMGSEYDSFLRSTAANDVPHGSYMAFSEAAGHRNALDSSIASNKPNLYAPSIGDFSVQSEDGKAQSAHFYAGTSDNGFAAFASKSSTPSPGLPGPAKLRLEQYRKTTKREEANSNAVTSGDSFVSRSSEDASNNDFDLSKGLAQHASWLYALLLLDFPIDRFHLGLSYEVPFYPLRASFMCHCNIQSILKDTNGCVKKVDYLVAFLKSFLTRSTDPMVLLVDPTGHIPACCHGGTWVDQYDTLQPGATVILRNVTVYRALRSYPYVLITHRSLVRVIAARPMDLRLKHAIEEKQQRYWKQKRETLQKQPFPQQHLGHKLLGKRNCAPEYLQDFGEALSPKSVSADKHSFAVAPPHIQQPATANKVTEDLLLAAEKALSASGDVARVSIPTTSLASKRTTKPFAIHPITETHFDTNHSTLDELLDLIEKEDL